MGCGKSKHDVVADTTINKSKRSNNGDHANDEKSTTKSSSETTTNPAVQQEANARGNGDGGVVDVKESAKAKVGSDEGNVKVEGSKVKESESGKSKPKVENAVKESENVVKLEMAVAKEKETKVVIVAEDLKEKNEIKDSTGENEKQGQGKIIPSESQSHLYDGNIDGVISDGLSGATVYYSPPHTTKDEEIPKLENVVVKSVEETKKETTNEEIAMVTEEASVKEEVIPTVKTNIAEPEKVASASETNVSERSSEEPKTIVAETTGEEHKANVTSEEPKTVVTEITSEEPKANVAEITSEEPKTTNEEPKAELKEQ